MLCAFDLRLAHGFGGITEAVARFHRNARTVTTIAVKENEL